MSRRSVLKECKKLSVVVGQFNSADDDAVLPPCNGIDRILFQARFINRARKTDPVLMAPIIEATKKSLLANLANRPKFLTHRAVISAISETAAN